MLSKRNEMTTEGSRIDAVLANNIPALIESFEGDHAEFADMLHNVLLGKDLDSYSIELVFTQYMQQITQLKVKVLSSSRARDAAVASTSGEGSSRDH